MDNDIEIFKGKHFSDLCKDIYKNSQTTRNQVEILISELRSLVNGLNDAITVGPLIKDYLDLSVKNDDQLVKLAAIVQRIQAKQALADSVGGDFVLSEEEKKQLLGEVETIALEDGRAKEANSINIDEIVSNAKEKLEENK